MGVLHVSALHKICFPKNKRTPYVLNRAPSSMSSTREINWAFETFAALFMMICKIFCFPFSSPGLMLSMYVRISLDSVSSTSFGVAMTAILNKHAIIALT